MFKSREERQAEAARKQVEQEAELERQAAQRRIQRERDEKRAGINRETKKLEAKVEQLQAELKLAYEVHQRDCAPKWAYKEVTDLDAQQLEVLGSWGWELVTTTSYSVTEYGDLGRTNMWHTLYTFKRPVAESTTPVLQELALSIANMNREIDQLKEKVAAL